MTFAALMLVAVLNLAAGDPQNKRTGDRDKVAAVDQDLPTVPYVTEHVSPNVRLAIRSVVEPADSLGLRARQDSNLGPPA